MCVLLFGPNNGAISGTVNQTSFRCLFAYVRYDYEYSSMKHRCCGLTWVHPQSVVRISADGNRFAGQQKPMPRLGRVRLRMLSSPGVKFNYNFTPSTFNYSAFPLSFCTSRLDTSSVVSLSTRYARGAILVLGLGVAVNHFVFRWKDARRRKVLNLTAINSLQRMRCW